MDGELLPREGMAVAEIKRIVGCMSVTEGWDTGHLYWPRPNSKNLGKKNVEFYQIIENSKN